VPLIVVEATIRAYAEESFGRRKQGRKKITRRAPVTLGLGAEWLQSLDGSDRGQLSRFIIL
jgi:hypothetical protein